MKRLSCLIERACLILICAWGCFIPLLPNIHPLAIGHHSRCVFVPPSGISHLPPAFSLSLHLFFSPPVLPSITLCSLSFSLSVALHLFYKTTGQRISIQGPPSELLFDMKCSLEVDNVHCGQKEKQTNLLSQVRHHAMCVSPGSPYQSRSSITSRASGLAPSHRIKDRDYVGWMDFGRRSAEEYEYSS